MNHRTFPSVLAVPLIMFAASCTHMQVLGPQADWLGKTVAFPHYSIAVPNDPRWWVVSTDQKKQTISLVVPAADKSSHIIVDGDKPSGMLMIRTSGGLGHPDAYTLYDGMLDVYMTPVPTGLQDVPDAQVVEAYLREDAGLYLQAGMVPNSAKLEARYDTFGSREFTVSRLYLGGAATGTLYVACTIVTPTDKRYLLCGRLWSKQSEERDYDYMAALLSSVDVK